MTVSLLQLIIWIIIAAVVGLLGEILARRRAPDGIIGAIIVGLIAIFLIVGVLHVSIFFGANREPTIEGVPLLSSILAAALLVILWSGFAYHRVYRPTYDRYYRRGSYARRPRRRLL